MSMNVKKGDTVVVLSGKDRGKQGKVLGTVPADGKVVVEGINMVTCHVKPRKQGETGGIVKREAALAACKVQVVCPKCSKATRVSYKIENGKKTRVCKKCGAELQERSVTNYGKTEREVQCRGRSRSDEAVRLQVRHADPQDRQGRRQRRLRRGP